MRTTVTIDDTLLENAKQLSGISETSTLLRHALQQLVHREASRKLRRSAEQNPTSLHRRSDVSNQSDPA